MTVSLSKDVAEFIQNQVDAGISPDATTLVNQLLCSHDPMPPTFDGTDEDLEKWLLEGIANRTPSLAPGDFDGIRRRVLERFKAEEQ